MSQILTIFKHRMWDWILIVYITWFNFFYWQEDDAKSLGSSSPDSTGSVETSISSHFGGMNYPSLFSSKPSTYGSSQTRVCILLRIYGYCNIWRAVYFSDDDTAAIFLLSPPDFHVFSFPSISWLKCLFILKIELTSAWYYNIDVDNWKEQVLFRAIRIWGYMMQLLHGWNQCSYRNLIFCKLSMPGQGTIQLGWFLTQWGPWFSGKIPLSFWCTGHAPSDPIFYVNIKSYKRVQIREEPPSYSSPIMKRYESFENPLASQSFESRDDDQASSVNVRHGSALYDFTAGGDDEVSGFRLLTLYG